MGKGLIRTLHKILSLRDVEVLRTMLDQDGDGQITYEELMATIQEATEASERVPLGTPLGCKLESVCCIQSRIPHILPPVYSYLSSILLFIPRQGWLPRSGRASRSTKHSKGLGRFSGGTKRCGHKAFEQQYLPSGNSFLASAPHMPDHSCPSACP